MSLKPNSSSIDCSSTEKIWRSTHLKTPTGAGDGDPRETAPPQRDARAADRERALLDFVRRRQAA